jgi:hypothetical protein
MRFCTISVAAIAIAVAMPLAGQTPPAFPALDIRVPVSPRPFVAGGATRLVYELHITNLSSRPTILDAVEVRDRSASVDSPTLLHLEQGALESAVQRPGAPQDDTEKRVLPAGRTAIVFVWLTVPTGAVPMKLTHRFALRVASLSTAASSVPGHGGSESDDPLTISGVDVPVSTTKPLVIGPPLEGDLWLAANGADNAVGHRRTLLALSGEARIAQRFAVDWVRLFEDGRTFRGDPRDNASYRAFGSSVLAVADGVVVDAIDGLPENVPDPVARAVPITPTTLGGNHIVLDLGHDNYATYAHLQLGSLQVKKGDNVRRGQVIALVGNTGNSTEPHLHFQLADRRIPFDAEGIPYVFESFELERDPEQVTHAIRHVDDSLRIDLASLSSPTSAPPKSREREMPLLNSLVRFVDGHSARQRVTKGQ